MKPTRLFVLAILTMCFLADTVAQPELRTLPGSYTRPATPQNLTTLGTISGHVYLRPTLPWGPAPYYQSLMVVILNEEFNLPGAPIPGGPNVPGGIPLCCPPAPGCPCILDSSVGIYSFPYQFSNVPFGRYRIGLGIPDSAAVASNGKSGGLTLISFASNNAFSPSQGDTASARLLNISLLQPSAMGVDIYYAEQCP